MEENQKNGAIAEKFEAGYFRSLYFADPPRQAAMDVYKKYRSGGVPTPEDYKTFQDYVFRYLVTEGGRLHLPVHIHTAVGEGDYFQLRKGDVLNLENVLKDPRYLNTTFVLIHGGYPYFREVIWLAAMKNVYLDSSEIETLVYPSEMKNVLKYWLETYPDKITFGSDSYPYSAALGSEETYWLGVYSARDALAAALAEMVASNEVTEDKALEIAQRLLARQCLEPLPARSLIAREPDFVASALSTWSTPLHQFQVKGRRDFIEEQNGGIYGELAISPIYAAVSPFFIEGTEQI